MSKSSECVDEFDLFTPFGSFPGGNYLLPTEERNTTQRKKNKERAISWQNLFPCGNESGVSPIEERAWCFGQRKSSGL
jgi:hypothetical protein